MAKRTRNVPLLTAIVATAITTLLAIIHAKVAPLPGLAKLEGFSIDARFRMRGDRDPATDRVVIVALDDKLRQEAWDVFQTRRGWARLLDALTAYDPKAIALDVFFDAPEVILDDALAARVRTLAATLAVDEDPKLAEAKAVLAAVVEQLRGDEVVATTITNSKRIYLGALGHLGAKTASAPELPGLGLARHGNVADAGGGGNRRPANASYISGSLPEIAKGAIGAGLVNNFRDDDGVTRRVPLAIEHAGRHYMPLGSSVALAELGKPGDTRYLVGATQMQAGGRSLPISHGASLMLDVLGKNRIPRVSAADVLAGRTCSARSISFA